eukprot:7456481-Pyramimonas_sp.AAC.1
MIRVSGVPKWAGSRMWTRPLGPLVELPVGHDPREACAEVGRGRHATAPTGAAGGAPCGARYA